MSLGKQPPGNVWIYESFRLGILLASYAIQCNFHMNGFGKPSTVCHTKVPICSKHILDFIRAIPFEILRGKIYVGGSVKNKTM